MRADKVVAVDLDGVIYKVYWDTKDVMTQYKPFIFGGLVPGAKQALTELRDQGYKIIVHSARTSVGPSNTANIGFTQKQIVDAITNRLDQDAIPYDEIWTEAGKPYATYYIDDKGIPFLTWNETMRQIDAS